MTIHGQIAGAAFTDEVRNNLIKIISGKISGSTLKPFEGDEAYTITQGKASGLLTGGNLSLLSAIVGTPHLDSFKNKIVFIEDVGEKPYRMDRMLTQLIHGSDLCKANGIIIGQCADCEKDADDKSWTLREVLEDRLKPLNIPTCYGLPFGHVDQNMAMPLLINVSIDATKITMTYEEEAVE